MFFMGGGLVLNFNIQMNSPIKYLGWLKIKPYVSPHLQLACPRSTQLKCRCSRNAQSLLPIPSPPQRQMTGNTCLLLTFFSGLYFRVKIGKIQLILVCSVLKKDIIWLNVSLKTIYCRDKKYFPWIKITHTQNTHKVYIIDIYIISI